MKATYSYVVVLLAALLWIPSPQTRTTHAHNLIDKHRLAQKIAPRTLASTTNTRQAPNGPIGEFVAFCPFSHRLHDDPIVFPGQPHASHSHEFFGNITTDANTTAESLLASGTTCNPDSDRSSYWAPTLYDAQGQEIATEQATFYYLVHINTPASLQPFPVGLKIIAGNAKATSPEEAEHIKWSCLGAPDSSTGDFVTCPADSKLELLVNYPDCWDGQNLDSNDHQSHMAYSSDGACPATHPVAVPALQFKLRYATAGGPGMSLSSGAGYTVHADFFNAWEPAAQENRLQCLRELIKCGPEGYPQGQTLDNLIYLPVINQP